MKQTKAEEIEEPLLNGQDKETELDADNKASVNAVTSGAEMVADAPRGGAPSRIGALLLDLLDRHLPNRSAAGTKGDDEKEDDPPATNYLDVCLQNLQNWIRKGQFLVCLPLATLQAALGGGLNFYPILFVLTLLPLWTATVVFPVANYYADVRFLDLLPMVVLVVLLLNFGPLPQCKFPFHLLKICMLSFFCLPGTLCAKKLLILRGRNNSGSTQTTEGRARAMALGFAVISFCFAPIVDIEGDSCLMLIAHVLFVQMLIVAIIAGLGNSPVKITSLITVMYPCLPFQSIKEIEDKDQEAYQNQQEEREAKLERQYLKLGGRSPSSAQSRRRHHGFTEGEIHFPIIMGILVLWSLSFLWYSQMWPALAEAKEGYALAQQPARTIQAQTIKLDSCDCPCDLTDWEGSVMEDGRDAGVWVLMTDEIATATIKKCVPVLSPLYTNANRIKCITECSTDLVIPN